MAYPRVFISSTCYDLGEVRDNLVEFLNSYYYEPVLSNKGDIFYHPDLHTHESCINEIENCHLLVLIIGGRFGGEYKADIGKSITNAEYSAAMKLKIPVFTFVKREVFEDHILYQRNKQNKKIISQINFPSIEKQEYSRHIFEFINSVRLAEINNGFFPFEYARDIKELLGKQFSGMIYDFLSRRIKEKEQIRINRVLDNLTLVNRKTEEIIENIYKQVAKGDASQKIDEIDQFLMASKFFKVIFSNSGLNAFEELTNTEIADIDITNKNWIEFLVSTKDFEIMKHKSKTGSGSYEWLQGKEGMGFLLKGNLNNAEILRLDECEKLYNSYKNLSKEKKNKILDSLNENY